ncbi:hypothetical protein QBC33DRAFT_578629 [Phialemonium atrogriseum]|uniref:Uncharacterized protein n=1 Tax=Phialemonium atrogriseum TaxID=1093897 RepID=A0AAJ0BZR7_9PEZI|nr:uncharacterized protein QBC33DRAFT_578629 [Phialemonium atrogriseum]KAK1766817.1 hypothetical protein QBC33DRAFT_578629 [Phialemonium atrogriseum]
MAHINIDAPPSSQNGDGDPSPSPRSTSTSLQAAATLNAGLQRGEPVRRSSSSSLSRSRQSPSADRRRSQILTTLQIADPGVPAPGEMVASDAHLTPTGSRTSSPRPLASSPRLSLTGPPHRDRAPSLGELHQELENEQEFQVNRLLQEIRRLQVQVQRQQQQQQQQQQQGQSAVGDEPTDGFGSLQTASAPQSAHPGLTSASGSLPRSPGFPHPRSSFDMARADIQRRSRTPSRGASPMLRSTSIGGESGDQWLLGGRDENAFYQAETQMLIRENQMLRHRIRDLERQLSELTGNGGGSSITHEPPHSSNLNRSTSVSEDDSTRLTPATSTSTPLPTVADAPKEE